MRSFPQRPYYDTFNELNKFMQVLYRPGWAVQTRELNEMQSILQNQIGSFADSIYANGSRVIGGEVTVNNKQAYIKLAAPIVGEASDYVGLEVANVGGTLKATIVNYVKAENGDPDTFYLDYSQSDSATNAQTFAAGSVVQITMPDTSIRSVTIASGTDATGIGVGVTINRGIYYSDRRFIPVEKQNLVLSKYSPATEETIQVGLNIVETLVTPEMDESLLDNASGSLNETAPGAHRYKVEAILVNRADLIDENGDPIDTGSTTININNYVQVVTVQNGEIVTKTRVNELSTLEDILARRTFDESGDYIINDFLIELREHLDDGTNRGIFTSAQGGDASKYVVVLDPGKAYVKGYELETKASTRLVGDKARDTAAKDELKVSTAYSSKFVINTLVNLPYMFSRITLREGIVNIGYAYVRSITYRELEAGVPQYNLEFFNPSFIVSGKGLNNVTNIIDDDTSFTAIVASVEVSGRSSMVLPIDHGFVQNISDVDVGFFKEYTATVNGTTVRIAAGTQDQFSGNINDYVVTINGVTTRPDSVTRLTGNIQADLGVTSWGAVDGMQARVFAFATRSGAIPKTKNLVTKNGETKTAASVVTLDNVDAQSIISIKIGTVDYTSYYELDGGQTETHYNLSSLKLRPGFTAPVGTLSISYTYFQHSLGDYFAPQSYENIDYEDIPYFKFVDGTEVFLGSCLDFRPKQSSALTYDTQSALSFSSVVDIDASFTYYLGRIDLVTLNKTGEFAIVKGIPSLNPVVPEDLDDAITLYELNVPPFTFDISDITARKLNYRRFTMKDIGNIESRLDRMEYVVALSLLEADANQKEFIDKFKSGFVVDNFKSQNVVDFNNVETDFGFDLTRGEGRPIVSAERVNLEPDLSQTFNVVIKNNKAYLPYTEVTETEQLLASKLERLQPFTLFNWRGTATLNPSQDNWVSTIRLPDQVIADANTQRLFPSLIRQPSLQIGSFFAWWGRARSVRRRGVPVPSRNAIVGGRTTVEQIGTEVSFSAVPFIRSRDVEFNAMSLKPFTKVVPYFDGVDVSEFCKPAGGNFGDPLVSNGIGQVIGTFRIPNSSEIRFRTGDRVFELLDDAESTSADATYSANGILESIRRVIRVTTRFTARTDPLAQSFSVGHEGGAFITSVDLWFGPDAASNGFDVKVELRGMTNGYPNPEVLAEKILAPDDILGSADATVATRFTFDNPVYLEQDVEYCFVVMSNSVTLTCFTAGLGEPAILPGGAQGEIIAKQPFIGSLFKSQNNITWEAAQTQDLKFRLNRAEFNNGVVGQVVFENITPTSDVGQEADPYRSELGFDPFTFTSGSNVISVKHIAHGFKSGDLVYLTGPSTGSMNGVPVTQIYSVTGKAVTVTGTDSYTIQSTTNATTSGLNGGAGQIASNQVKYSVINAAITDIVYTNTITEYSFKGKNFDTGLLDANWLPIEPREEYFFAESRVSKSSNDNSIFTRVLLKSAKSNLSPVVDLESAGLVCARNRINSFDDISGEAACVYVSQPVSLINPANEINVYLDINLPAEGTVKIFYKIGQKSVAETPNWIELPATSARLVSDDVSVFKEHTYQALPGQEFYAGQIKIVLSTTNEAKPPKLKNLRVLYVNDGA